MDLNDLLGLAIRSGASDLHLKAGLPPMLRLGESLEPARGAERLTPENTAELAFSIMSDHQKERFRKKNELDLGYGVPGLGRFRVNVFMQRGMIGAVFRVIPLSITTIALMVSCVVRAEEGAGSGPVLNEEVIAKRDARREEIANMSDEERAAAREQRREAKGERAGMSDADREARREKFKNMSNEDRQAMRDRMGDRQSAGGGQRHRGTSGSGGRRGS